MPDELADSQVPHCPACGAPMRQRVAGRGPRTGRPFWGCSRYPACKETADIENGTTSSEPVDAVRKPGLGYAWPSPPGFGSGERHFLPVSGVGNLRVPVSDRAIRWNQCCITIPPRRSARPYRVATRVVLCIAQRILQRGDAPPIPEWAIADLSALAPVTVPRVLVAPAWRSPDKSDAEERFFLVHTLGILGDENQRFLHLQVPLEPLARSERARGRRADFALLRPGSNDRALVIEIDGEGHAGRAAREVDSERDAALRAEGHTVVRIPANDARAGSGPKITELKALLADLPPLPAHDPDPVAVAQVAATVVTLVQEGLLEPGAMTWRIGLGGRYAARAEIGARFAVRLLTALDDLYGAQTAPGSLDTVVVDGTGAPTATSPMDVLIDWEHEVPWFAPSPLQATAGTTVVTVRPTWLPATAPLPSAPSEWVEPRPEVSRDTLRELLRTAFPGKEDFWEGQEPSLRRCLEGRDCLVLLPTGGGKSLIYQLAALLMPGLTLVVAPLVALMDDQVDNLKRAGIDRAIQVTRAVTHAGFSEQLHDLLRSGTHAICYIAPERLQIERFRDALLTIRESMPIPLVVVDEAHCVSEWGHDFRPAYLNLARIARRFGHRGDGTPPAIVGLTGTASRAVLRDLQNALDIRELDAVITPTHFHRKELRFETVQVSSDEKSHVLQGVVQALPEKLGIPRGQLFSPRDSGRACGIVFCPHASTKSPYSAAVVAQELGSRLHMHIPAYSGNNSDYERATVSRDFKEDKFSLLAATKAFGMGIDKPNVRYTIHYGLPPSLEAFYQEAGRAGRDRQPAHCVVLVSVDDSERAERLLSPACELSEVAQAGLASGDRDDIDRVLYFHSKAFRGVAADIGGVTQLLEKLGDLSKPDRITIGYRNDDEQRQLEQALHRLVALEVVSDYTVDYSKKRIELHKPAYKAGTATRAAREYISGYSRSRARLLFPDDKNHSKRSARDEILACVKTLVEFIYGTIELSRRAAIRSVWRWAVDGKRDNDRLWQILLDYLSETQFSAAVVEILREDEHSLPLWSELLEQVTSRRDADELYGALDRAQSDYPDHPAILAMRSVVAAMRGDEAEVASYAAGCLRYLRSRYGADRALVESYSSWLTNQITQRLLEAVPFAVLRMTAEDDGTVCRALGQQLTGLQARSALVPQMIRLLARDTHDLAVLCGAEE